MRSFASEESGAGTASDARLGPDRCAPAAAATRTSVAARTSAALAERRTGLAVEEVHARNVDGDGHLIGEAKDRVGRELGDEVGPRGDDALCARRRFRDFLVLALANRERVDLEIDHRLAPERLDEL